MYLKLATGAGETARRVSACCANMGPRPPTISTPVKVVWPCVRPSTQRRGDRQILGTCWAAILATQQAPGPVRNLSQGSKAESHSRTAGLLLWPLQAHTTHTCLKMSHSTLCSFYHNQKLLSNITSLLSNVHIKFPLPREPPCRT